MSDDRDKKLELADRPQRAKYVEPAPYRPVSRPPLPKWPLVALLVVGGALAAWRVPRLRGEVMRLLPMRTPRPLVIMSEPNGATVTIDGKVVGTTPWAGDNHWQGMVPYEVSLAGHKTVKGSFEGEQEQSLDVTLIRAK